MVSETVKKRAIRSLVQALQKYAESQGWQSEDYRIFYWGNWDWGKIHLILVARAFPGRYEDQWLTISEYLKKELKDEPVLRKAFNLELRTFDQVEEGGLYAIHPDYEDADEFLVKPSLGAK